MHSIQVSARCTVSFYSTSSTAIRATIRHLEDIKVDNSVFHWCPAHTGYIAILKKTVQDHESKQAKYQHVHNTIFRHKYMHTVLSQKPPT